MDQNKFKGNWQQFKGELKKKWGQLTDDDLLECEGTTKNFYAQFRKDTATKKTKCSIGLTIGIPNASRKKSAGDMRPLHATKLDSSSALPFS